MANTSKQQLINIRELKSLITPDDEGLLFCFGTSTISKIIQLKTRKNKREIVPSHVAMIYNGFLYESTSNGSVINMRKIPAGVRRYRLQEFYNLEKDKSTKYYFYPTSLSRLELEFYVHYPYGIDAIVDFVFKNKSNNNSEEGLICSQYANYCAELMDVECPSPAVLYRHILGLDEQMEDL